MEQTSLKPCPFCGKKANITKAFKNYIVGCFQSNCPGNIKVFSAFFLDKQDAIVKWNARFLFQNITSSLPSKYPYIHWSMIKTFDDEYFLVKQCPFCGNNPKTTIQQIATHKFEILRCSNQRCRGHAIGDVMYLEIADQVRIWNMRM